MMLNVKMSRSNPEKKAIILRYLVTFRPADEACTNVGGDKLAARAPKG